MKPFEDWSYDDLCSAIAWEFVRGIVSGRKLESIVSQTHRTHVVWHEMVTSKKDKPKPPTTSR